MNRKDCLVIIDYFADKTLSFGCRIEDTDRRKLIVLNISGFNIEAYEEGSIYNSWDLDRDSISKVLGHKVLLTTVLEKLKVIGGWTTNLLELCTLWMRCGFTRSMQEIIENSGFENISCDYCHRTPAKCRDFVYCECGERLKDKNARALFTFLETVKK